MPKILLAEDDHTMITLLATLLKMEGFEVIQVDANADVLSMVSLEVPDALVMDVHLGEQNGMDIVASIRQKTDLAKINIVMTSGLDLKNESLERGANHFLLKPFMPDDLLKILRT